MNRTTFMFKVHRISKLAKYTIVLPIIVALVTTLFPQIAFASAPASTHYQIEDYGFGGGVSGANSSGGHYSIFGVVGETDQGNPLSSHYGVNAGLTYTIVSNVPGKPTLTNPSSYYNKLHLTINNGSNPTDTVFAIQISTDAFASNKNYIQTDDTVGVSAAWQTYTSWGGASGFTIIGLLPGVTYTVRVTAKQGNYTQSPFSPNSDSIATANPTMSFSLSTNAVTISNIVPNTVTAGNATVTTSVSTNATGGATVYVSDSNGGLVSTNASHTITSATADLSSASEGYGLRGTAVSQTSGGPMEILSPYNGASNNVGAVSTTKTPIFDSTNATVSGGSATFEVKAKVAPTTGAASDYSDILTLVVAGSF